MKKALVFGLTAAAICFITSAGLLLSGGVRKLYGMSADALAGEYAPSRPAPEPSMQAPAPSELMMDREEGAADKRRMKPPKPAALGVKGLGAGGGGRGLGFGGAPGSPSVAKKMAPELAKDDAAPEGAEEATGEAPTRAWFPETFLFEPLVVTDAQGRAHVPVKVPDRLTTWRVLALAHAREGSQAGAVASFLGTLPTYVEPVTPPFLAAGDVVRLPVQLVNTTDAEVTGTLSLAAQGATLSSTGGAVRVPAGGSTVQYVTLTTTTPGAVRLRAALGGTDAVERDIDVQPSGRREVVSQAGTLAAPRTFTLTGPANPLPGTEAVRVRVYPGALGLLRSELSAAPGRGGVAEDAYLLQLLGEAPGLLRGLGATPEESVIRELSLLATQRVMQFARAPSVDAATLLTEAALAHPGNPVLARLGERLAQQVAQAQRPDGTCQGATGWTLQRLLVMTGECVRAARASSDTPAARQRATVVALKASGAVERNLARVGDAYTAAALVASGAATGSVAEQLRAQVLAALADAPGGAKLLEVDPSVQRADGARPSSFEATAMAILALDGVAGAPLADLGTYLLSGYTPSAGWGDGRANLAALRAVLRLFKAPVPEGVRVVVTRDGQEVTSGVFDARALQDVLVLDAAAPGSAGAHEWAIRAEPAVPGLGYSLQLVAWTPWRDEPGGGLELTTALPAAMRAGLPATVKLTAAVPGGLPMRLVLGLPAGVQPDSTSLERLVSRGAVTRHESEDGRLTLHLPAQASGAVWAQELTVVATLGGTLRSGASRLEVEGQPSRGKDFAPVPWRVE